MADLAATLGATSAAEVSCSLELEMYTVKSYWKKFALEVMVLYRPRDTHMCVSAYVICMCFWVVT